MKSSNLSKLVGASVLTLSLALPATLPATAQTNNAPANSNRTTTVDNDRYQGTDNARGDRDFDWGWLGLLGLAGLAGLMRRRQEEPARYREPNEVGTPGPRY